MSWKLIYRLYSSWTDQILWQFLHFSFGRHLWLLPKIWSHRIVLQLFPDKLIVESHALMMQNADAATSYAFVMVNAAWVVFPNVGSWLNFGLKLILKFSGQLSPSDWHAQWLHSNPNGFQFNAIAEYGCDPVWELKIGKFNQKSGFCFGWYVTAAMPRQSGMVWFKTKLSTTMWITRSNFHMRMVCSKVWTSSRNTICHLPNPIHKCQQWPFWAGHRGTLQLYCGLSQVITHIFWF